MGFEWIAETCLACDNQTPAGAAYCSQSCRLADTERASCTSSNSSPKSASSYGSASSSSNGFNLPPAYNFSSHSPSHYKRSSQPAYPATFSSSASSSARHRSALQTPIPNSYSTRSYAVSGGHHGHLESPSLSDKTAQELKDYANCFDQVRDLKRRMSIV